MPNLVNHTTSLKDGAYQLEIIRASFIKGVVYLAGMACSVDLQIFLIVDWH